MLRAVRLGRETTAAEAGHHGHGSIIT
jgi:hypothetical protein